MFDLEKFGEIGFDPGWNRTVGRLRAEAIVYAGSGDDGLGGGDGCSLLRTGWERSAIDDCGGGHDDEVFGVRNLEG